MGRSNDATNKSLLQRSSIVEVLMLEHTHTPPAPVELCFILVNVNHDVRAPNRCANISLRLACECSVRVTGWTVFAEVRIAEPLLLPVVLSRQEVAAVLNAVRQPRLRVCLELNVRQGKSGHDRFVPLS